MYTVLILNYNDSNTVINNINRIKEYSNIEKIVIVDNFSTDDSYNNLKKYENNKIKIIKTDKNGGYGYGNNYGINYIKKNLKSKYVLLANPDTIIEEHVIDKMVDFLSTNEDYSIVAPYMLDSNGLKQINTAFNIPSKVNYILTLSIIFDKISNMRKKNYYGTSDFITVEAVSGSLFMFDIDKMIKYGMYDENIFLYCEEVVLGMKLKRNNQKVALLLNDYFVHNHSVSISKTYKNEIAKRKLLIKSKIYVLKTYYKINPIELFVAKIIGKFSLFECFLIEITVWKVIKKVLRKK